MMARWACVAGSAAMLCVVFTLAGIWSLGRVETAVQAERPRNRRRAGWDRLRQGFPVTPAEFAPVLLSWMLTWGAAAVFPWGLLWAGTSAADAGFEIREVAPLGFWLPLGLLLAAVWTGGGAGERVEPAALVWLAAALSPVLLLQTTSLREVSQGATRIGLPLGLLAPLPAWLWLKTWWEWEAMVLPHSDDAPGCRRLLRIWQSWLLTGWSIFLWCGAGQFSGRCLEWAPAAVWQSATVVVCWMGLRLAWRSASSLRLCAEVVVRRCAAAVAAAIVAAVLTATFGAGAWELHALASWLGVVVWSLWESRLTIRARRDQEPAIAPPGTSPGNVEA